ncbi:hypothetical protein [Streptomyces sp. NPDC056628]|uniref:hypothetical protein n=1 Tax=Streptomyces sp. NPDC056628 TaxID=3345882 RepID=UPI0036B1ABDA
MVVQPRPACGIRWATARGSRTAQVGPVTSSATPTAGQTRNTVWVTGARPGVLPSVKRQYARGGKASETPVPP